MTTKSIKYALTIVAREVMRKELEPCVVPVKDEFLAGVLEAGDDVGAFGFGGEEVKNDVGESRHRTGSQGFDPRQRHRRRLTVGDEA